MREFIENCSFFGITLTFVIFMILEGIRRKFKIKTPFFSPLLISSAIIIVILLVFNIDYDVYNKSTQYVTYWLTPLTISLAVPLYRRVKELKDNLAAVIISIIMGCIGHAAILIGFTILFGISPLLFHSVLPKSVTTAIALGLSDKIGGMASVTVVGVTISGLTGAVFGPLVLKLCKIKEPVAQGLAMGTASHAIGTSKAMEFGEVQGAMSSLAIVVTGILSVIIVPIAAGIIK